MKEKKECLKDGKTKKVTINIDEFKALKATDRFTNSEKGKELYSHRGNKCESPHGFIIYNLNGKKMRMVGLKRTYTIAVL